MTGYQLFQRRLKLEWKFKSKLFFTVVDWVTWLYVLIPLILIAGYHYVQLWQHSYTWPELLTPIILLVGLFLWSLTGHLRFFIEDADQVFIRHHHRLFRSLRLYAILYSFFRSTLGNGLLFLIILPLLVQYLELSGWAVLMLFLLTSSFRCLHHVLHTYSFLLASWWKKILLQITVLLLSGAVFIMLGLWTIQLDLPLSKGSEGYAFAVQSLGTLIGVGFILILIWFLVRKRLSLAWSFPYDSAFEQEKRSRYVGFLLQQAKHIGAPEFERKTRKKGKRTFLNRVWLKRKMEPGKRSLAPESHIQAIFYRYALRNKLRVSGAFRLTAAFISAIVLIPGWFKLGMWLFSIGLILYYFNTVWNEFIRHEYIKLFQWKNRIRQSTALRSIYFCCLPTILMTSLLVGTLLFSLWAGMLTVAAGLAIGYGISFFLNPNVGPVKHD